MLGWLDVSLPCSVAGWLRGGGRQQHVEGEVFFLVGNFYLKEKFAKTFSGVEMTDDNLGGDCKFYFHPTQGNDLPAKADSSKVATGEAKDTNTSRITALETRFSAMEQR